MKLLTDFLPIILFFIAYKLQGIYTATAVLIAAALLLMGWQFLRKGRVETMTLVSTGLVLLFGGATLYFHNDTFIKIKPSILYALFAAALLYTQWREQTLLERLMGGQLPATLPPAFWRRLNAYWIAFFLFGAILNLAVAYSLPTSIWVDFKLFGLLALTIIFILFQAAMISHALPQEVENGDSRHHD
ncbi:septation protein A [Acidithiobacillus sulfuriphilus]|uniref:Inner membrane-spanning protein YciB n=2 Tax=Acidithiobacillus sulfuriphilus TaxID=1867749 RepID=A0A3M8QW96_9PROT|nr:septation protein A [Acidithiobacillus sulfuriphilus]RNF60563.1 septation protein A [Acidithiobacillus sulfuriphilus]